MAQTDRDVFDKVGQYNLDEIAIISYRFADDSKPRRIDIKGILYNFEITEDILLNNIVGSVIVYDMQDIRTIMPMVHDSDTVLRIKFQHFIESKSNFKENHPICNNKNTSVLNWFANLQNDFWSEDIDKIIRYESLLEDFNSVCNTFNISVPKMPKLKTSQRKANKHYSTYYNSYTKDIVHDAFSGVIKKFNYEF